MLKIKNQDKNLSTELSSTTSIYNESVELLEEKFRSALNAGLADEALGCFNKLIMNTGVTPEIPSIKGDAEILIRLAKIIRETRTELEQLKSKIKKEETTTNRSDFYMDNWQESISDQNTYDNNNNTGLTVTQQTTANSSNLNNSKSINFNPKDLPVEIEILMGMEKEEEIIYEHNNIVEDGFRKFMDALTSEDPAGDFTNLLPICYQENPYEEFSKLILKENLKLPSGQVINLELRPGEIAELAGHNFNTLKDPISFAIGMGMRKTRFLTMYAMLTDPHNYEEIQMLTQRIKEGALLNKSSRVIYKKTAEGLNEVFYEIHTERNILPGDFCHNRNLQLAANNFDHFGKEAQNTFETGLTCALEKAKAARETTDETAKKNLLRDAIGYGVYACHFLIDLYLIGHFNMYRKEILNVISQNQINVIPDLKNISHVKKLLAGIINKKMHDENQEKTMLVTNGRKEMWNVNENVDFNYFKQNHNGNKVREAVSLALQDIYLVYTNNPKEKPLFIESLKELIPQMFGGANQNHPLFRESKTKLSLEIRNKNNQYDLISLPALLGFFKIIAKKSNQEVKELTQPEMEMLMENTESIDCFVQ